MRGERLQRVRHGIRKNAAVTPLLSALRSVLRSVALGTLLVLLPGPRARASSMQDEGARLEQLRAELHERRAALKDLDNQQRSVLESLGQLEESLAQLAAAVAANERQLEQRRSDMAALERGLGYEEVLLAEARTRLGRRLRVLLVEGEGAGLRALLGATNHTDLALHMHLLRHLAGADVRLLEEVTAFTRRIESRRKALRDMAAALEQDLARSAEQQALLETTRTERRAALERLATERDLTARRARELAERHAALSQLVRTLAQTEARRPVGAAVRRVGVLKAGLAFPVDGLLIRRFGAIKSRDTGAEIVSNGIELRADAGAPVMAAADGRVVHVGWMRGFGRVVILDHGAGHHTISAHLSDTHVHAGDEVTRGQVVGAVGDTESPNGPKLYFELREHGLPRDPAPLLR